MSLTGCINAPAHIRHTIPQHGKGAAVCSWRGAVQVVSAKRKPPSGTAQYSCAEGWALV